MSRQHLSNGNKPWDEPQLGRPKITSRRSGSPYLSAIGLAQATLHVTLSEELLYLHPAPEGVPTEDPWVSGTVTLWLPKARNLRHITVRLVGKQDIGWSNHPYESTTILEREVSLFEEDKDVLLEKGEHTFGFQILVPSATAPYERCQHGRVRHTVTAKAKGIGAMGGDVVSSPKILFLVVNPGGAGASCPPPPLDHKIEGLMDEIGPYTIALQSQYIMVGGLLLMRFNLISPPTDIDIYSLKVKINQHFFLRSNVDPDYTLTPPVDARPVCILDASRPPNMGKVDAPGSGRSGTSTPLTGPLKRLAAGEAWKVSHLARIPNDNHLRPSTQPGTETGIRVHHTIAFEMTYRILRDEEEGKGKEKEHKERRKLVVSKPLDIFSCCCFLDSLTLPVYSFLDPHPEPESDSPNCVCGMKISAVIEHHGDTLLREEGEEGITYAPILKDEWLPSPPLPFSAPTRGRPGEGGRVVVLRTSDSTERLEGFRGDFS